MRSTAESKFKEKFTESVSNDLFTTEKVNISSNLHRDMVISQIEDDIKWAYNNSSFKN